MKVLNLYAGIGGNRKLWEGVEVTAVEWEPSVAKVYRDNFPDDKVIVGDAHEYLLNNYKDYDFIWSSPPCPTHSRVNYFLNPQGIERYPDMNLYQEIIFLKHFFKGKYCIENVMSYYQPLIQPQTISRHFFWANFTIPPIKCESFIGRMNGKKEDIGGTQKEIRDSKLSNLGFDLTGYQFDEKERLKALRNCVNPEVGSHILNCARGIIQREQIKQGQLF